MNNGPQRRRSRIVRRRRQAFLRLLAAAVTTLLLGLLPRMHMLLLVNLALDVAIVVYVLQLRRWARDERPRARHPIAPEPAQAKAAVHHMELSEEEADRKVELPDKDLAASR